MPISSMSSTRGAGSRKAGRDRMGLPMIFRLVKPSGLPILKSLDLLAERLTDAKLTPYINAVRDDVRKGVLLSEAFRAQGIFPKIYVTSVMAGTLPIR